VLNSSKSPGGSIRSDGQFVSDTTRQISKSALSSKALFRRRMGLDHNRHLSATHLDKAQICAEVTEWAFRQLMKLSMEGPCEIPVEEKGSACRADPDPYYSYSDLHSLDRWDRQGLVIHCRTYSNGLNSDRRIRIIIKTKYRLRAYNLRSILDWIAHSIGQDYARLLKSSEPLMGKHRISQQRGYCEKEDVRTGASGRDGFHKFH